MALELCGGGRVALCHQGNPRDPGQGRGLKRNRLHPGFSLRFCPGLKELTLSANPGITPKGWSRLAIAVAHSSQVRVLNLDYNPLGEAQGSPLRVSPPHPHPRAPVQDPLVACHGNPTTVGGWEGKGDLEDSREAAYVEDQMTNRCIKVSITTPGPGLLHRFTGHSAPLLATYRQHLLARGWDLGLLGHWGGCGEEG